MKKHYQLRPTGKLEEIKWFKNLSSLQILAQFSDFRALF